MMWKAKKPKNSLSNFKLTYLRAQMELKKIWTSISKQKNHIFRLRMFLERLGHSKYSKNQKREKVATLGPAPMDIESRG